MDKKTAQNLIEDTFNDSFSEERFTIFAKNLLNDLESKNDNYHSNQKVFKEAFKDHIYAYKRIGKYIDPDGEALDVLIIQVNGLQKLEKARTSLRNFVIYHLKTFEKEYALVAFVDKDDKTDWRFSFVKLEYSSKLNDKTGKVKNKEETLSAKRYSFLVGANEKAHTAKNQLLPLLQNIANNPTIAELEKAFSIEKVTDEFFEEYKKLFGKLYHHFDDSDQIIYEIRKEKPELAEVKREDLLARFTKKLLGQIVFLYFLQKKKWLGVPENKKWGEGSPKFLQELFDRAQKENKNYFKDYLQFLFYQALAKPPENEHGYYIELEGKFPFLNGGLFEADYKWDQAKLAIPDYLFRSGEDNEDKRTGILDVFDRYNFTIKEDEPLDKEVAVDPEMLGKVFENMLDITERKSKGAFYTPREIVHYMCQESLIHYLDNVLEDKVGKKDIETYIREGHFAIENDERVASKGETKTYKFEIPESIRQNADLIDQKLNEIRICDPAIGSGAFPVGLLHELVNSMLVLKPHFSYDYLCKKLDEFKIPYRESYSESRYIYRLKRHIIQESIYGVDIDASAIDIARLRLWLSLVVDEDDLDPIETLPNLDYKIVCGNSLIGLPYGAMRNLQVEAELEKLKEDFYDITDEIRKKALRQKINTKIRELLDSAEEFAGYKIDFDFKLFFSEVWREKGGFDVVIGNPPYVGISKVDYKEVLKKIKYETFATSGDLYVLFYENGYRALKPNGNVNFITSNKWINSSYGTKTRNFFAKKTNPALLIDFAKVRIFPNATVFVNILMLERSNSNRKVEAVVIEGNHLPTIPLQTYFDENKVILSINGEEVWKIGSTKALNVNKAIEEKGLKLKDWKSIEFFRGITTGLNSAFHFGKEIRDNLVQTYRKNDDYIYPLLRGKDIKRWRYDYADWHMLFIPWHFPLHSDSSISKASNEAEQAFKSDFPAIYNHLYQFRDELANRNKDETGIRYEWYALQRYGSNYWTEFLKEKIVWIEISDKANYAYDEKGHFLTNSAYFISGENLKYLISVLNSSVSDYYFFQITAKIAGGRKRYTKQYVEQVPIPSITKQQQLPYEKLVDYVLIVKSKASDIVFKFFESLLDSIVFELYFPEEIKSAGKEILKHLGDLKPITDDLSEETKLAIIQSEFERLYNPNHPVRFAIETLDSVEEVRIIKEALK
jgi:23S rRNA G2445 N2-methylase RlmL